MVGPGLDLFEELPAPPNPTDDELAGFHDISDWTGLFFEWHKTVGILAITFSFILQDSPAVKKISRKKYLILTSLLNRCGRLMMANLRLASENRHREAIFIVDRALHETAIKLMWLCRAREKDRFDTFLADGLKNDIKFESYIRQQAKKRGHKVEIERRMLDSIRRSIATSGISRSKIVHARRPPSMETMMQELEIGELGYIVVQRMGSHHVSWNLDNIADSQLGGRSNSHPQRRVQSAAPKSTHVWKHDCSGEYSCIHRVRHPTTTPQKLS